MIGEPWDDGTFWDDGTGWVDSYPSAKINVRVLPRPTSSWATGEGFADRRGVQDGVWHGEVVRALPLVEGGGDVVALSRGDGVWGEVPVSAAYRLPEVTLRIYLLPTATPAYTPENQEKFLIANSVKKARGPGAFSIERKGELLAAYLHDESNSVRWFDDAADGLPGAVMPEDELACIELVQSATTGAKLRLNGDVVASMPDVRAGWQQADAVGFIVGAWGHQHTPHISIGGKLGPIEVFPYALPDHVRPSMESFVLPLPPPPPPPQG